MVSESNPYIAMYMNVHELGTKANCEVCTQILWLRHKRLIYGLINGQASEMKKIFRKSGAKNVLNEFP